MRFVRIVHRRGVLRQRRCVAARLVPAESGAAGGSRQGPWLTRPVALPSAGASACAACAPGTYAGSSGASRCAAPLRARLRALEWLRQWGACTRQAGGEKGIYIYMEEQATGRRLEKDGEGERIIYIYINHHRWGRKEGQSGLSGCDTGPWQRGERGAGRRGGEGGLRGPRMVT